MGLKSKHEPMLPKDFKPISSADDPRANGVDVRKLMGLAGGKSFRGGAGFLEASIEDIRAKGGAMYGRCCMHPEAAVGIKTYGYKVPRYIPCKEGEPGAFESRRGMYKRPMTKEETRQAKKDLKEIRYLIGCNMNGSGIGKCMTAAAFVKLGIRCVLRVNGVHIVDNWPDYCKCCRAQSEYEKKYDEHGCAS